MIDWFRRVRLAFRRHDIGRRQGKCDARDGTRLQAVIILLVATVPALPASPPISPGPLAPSDSLRRIHVPAGYRVELVAAEPLLYDPVAFDWDERGRLWVVEMADYPLGMDGNGAPGGRIRILEDTTGDGRFDRARLFAEGLNFPTGILTWRGGCLVTAAPDILFLPDADGDGRADERRTILSGFREGNQQLRVNGLRWGLDGWVYCAIGGHTASYTEDTQIVSVPTGATLRLGSRDFRFKPDTGEVDPLSGPAQFGRSRDAWGRWFGTQNSFPLWHYVLEDYALRRNPHVTYPNVRRMLTRANPPVYPASPPEKRFHHFDQAGRYTSACSGLIDLDAVMFGARADGRMDAFVCEPFANLVQHLVLEESGVSFEASVPENERPDFFASEDRWCRPVMVRTGPDGALWIADMYRYIIEHPQWLPQEGRDELMAHYRAGDDRGRMYRVFPDKAPRAGFPALAAMDVRQLAEQLQSSNGWVRDKAHMLLLWSADKGAVPVLDELSRSSPRAETRMQAMWVLAGLGALGPEHVLRGLADSHPGVRENALRLAERSDDGPVISRAATLAADPAPRVRIALARSLGAWTHSEASRAFGELMRKHGMDPWVRAALLSSAIPHLETLTRVALENDELLPPAMRTALGERREDLVLLMAEDVFSRTGANESVWSAWYSLLSELRSQNTSLVELARTSGASPRWQRLAEQVTQQLRTWRGRAQEAREPAERRAKLAAVLLAHPPERDAGVEIMAELLGNATLSDTLRRESLARLVDSRDGRVPGLLLTEWQQKTPRQREAVLDALMSREEWAHHLLAEVEAGRVGASSFDAQRQSRLLKHPSSAVRQQAEKVFTRAASRREVLDRFAPALHLPGDAARGRAAFFQACHACHELEGEGRPLGPDLRSVVEHPPEKLLVSILDPNANIEPGFTAYFVRLKTGEQLHGIIDSETGSAVTLRLADLSRRNILRADIERIESAQASLMPEGLEAMFTPQSMADLIAYLRQPK